MIILYDSDAVENVFTVFDSKTRMSSRKPNNSLASVILLRAERAVFHCNQREKDKIKDLNNIPFGYWKANARLSERL